MHRAFGRASKLLPVVGLVALVLAAIAGVTESSPVDPDALAERALRVVLFVLSCFVGSYMPVPGQPEFPSTLSALALTMALITSLGGVALAVLTVFSKEVGLAIASSRRRRVVVLGDGPEVQLLAARLRAWPATVITVGDDDQAMIRVTKWADATADRRVRRALRGSREAYVLYESTVDGVIAAGEIRAMSKAPRTHQVYNWKMDRLVFRSAISDGKPPPNEVFSPVELTSIHLADLVAHLVRMRREVLRIHLRGEHHALEILRERLCSMRDVLNFVGGLEFTARVEDADVVILGVEQHEYVAAVEETVDPRRTILVIAPERYFAAVGREDLRVVASETWLAERDSMGRIDWQRRVVVVDDVVIGWNPLEIALGIRGRWARDFHNAHSDFTAHYLGTPGNPNRWLERPIHPRLHTMAAAAVDLMLVDLAALGHSLIVRNGAHDDLAAADIEYCARRIHEQYLELAWTGPDGVERRCAEYRVTAEGDLVSDDAPPSWAEDSEIGRERNRAMVRAVYPALASVFGYRITRTGVDRVSAS